MSLALKSNNIASNYLGNINGIKGKQDWVAFFDFENDEYTTQKNNARNTLTLADVITSTSAKNMAVRPQTMDKHGNRSYTQAATDIRHWKQADRFGLLVEETQTNWFVQSANPASQTISNIPAGSTIVASCIGSGSITISGTGIDTVVVTESTPKTITPQAQGSVISLNMVVSGTLSHAQVVRCSGFACVHSPITTTGNRPESGRDNLEINQALLGELIDANQPLIILIETVPMFQTNDSRATYNESSLMVETDNLIAAIGFNKTSDLRASPRLVSINKADGTAQFSASGAYQDIALNTPTVLTAYLSNSGSKTILNGKALFNATTAVNLNLVKRLRLATTIPSPQFLQGGNCIITKLAIFNRQMSDAELIEYAKSWN